MGSEGRDEHDEVVARGQLRIRDLREIDLLVHEGSSLLRFDRGFERRRLDQELAVFPDLDGAQVPSRGGHGERRAIRFVTDPETSAFLV
jgi:hypothetical protein